MNEEDLEYCPHCGDVFPVDEDTGILMCDCEEDPSACDNNKPLDFNRD